MFFYAGIAIGGSTARIFHPLAVFFHPVMPRKEQAFNAARKAALD
jgi:hypothetical protein